MKFIVDGLPYYGEECPFYIQNLCNSSANDCPRRWSRYKVCSKDNPHECEWLKEIENGYL